MTRRSPGNESRATSTPPSDDTDITGCADVLAFLRACYGDVTGQAHSAIGRDPHLKDRGPDKPPKYEHRRWQENHAAWPDRAEALAATLADASRQGDVYVCPYLMWADKRTPGGVVARILIHADVDRECDPQRVRDLGGFAIASGTRGGAHVYVPLSKSIPAYQHEALERGLVAHFGADAKISTNDLLRPPSTLNYKPTVTTPGAAPAAVAWLVRPKSEPVDPHVLAGKLGVILMESAVNGHKGARVAGGHAAVGGVVEPVDLTDYPAVREARDLDSGDRSADIMRITSACHDAGLVLANARWVVNTRANLVEKLGEVSHDDVLRCWLKVVDDRQNLAWTTGPRTPAGDPLTRGDPGDSEPTTWGAFDLGPYLRGEIMQPEPSLGLARSDGLRMLYPGREHVILGETEAGKTWFALACVVALLLAGECVVYIHYEEADPGSTIERLLLLGVPADVIASRLRFVAPGRPAQTGWIEALLDPAPSLVVHDGVNEGMTLHGHDIMSAEGAALFRRLLIRPCIQAGAATLSCDHLPKSRDGNSRDAYGSVHKGNAIDGARFVLDNVEPFGRGMRGASSLYVTKDRPGHLRTHGRASRSPGKTFVGILVADDESPFEPFSLMLCACKYDEVADDAAGGKLADAMFDVIAAQPDRTIGSARKLYAAMRAAGHTVREADYRGAVDDLVVAGRVTEVKGKRGATAFRTVATAAQRSDR